jgi:hypothetical protein
MPNQAIIQVFDQIKEKYKVQIREVKNDPNLENKEKLEKIHELTQAGKNEINLKKKELIAKIEEAAHAQELKHLAEIEATIQSM